jgi:hypothetical protein
MFCWKNNENYDKVKKKNFVKEIEFLKKSNDEKGHVFELLFSDELYNFLFGEVKRGVFLGINRSTFCFEE